MKLYCAYDRKTNKIKAHTRDDELFNAYLKTLSKKKFRAVVIDTKQHPNEKEVKKLIEDIEQNHFDKTLSFMYSLEEPATEDEKDTYLFAEEEYDKLKFMVKDLKNIVDNYDLAKSDRKHLKQAYKILKELSKRKNFDKAVGLDAIIDVVKNSALVNVKKLFSIKEKEK